MGIIKFCGVYIEEARIPEERLKRLVRALTNELSSTTIRWRLRGAVDETLSLAQLEELLDNEYGGDFDDEDY